MVHIHDLRLSLNSSFFENDNQKSNSMITKDDDDDGSTFEGKFLIFFKEIINEENWVERLC